MHRLADIFRTKRLIKAKFVDALLEESGKHLVERKKGIKKMVQLEIFWLFLFWPDFSNLNS